MSAQTKPSNQKWVIGVCAMDTKARSRPMRHILKRLLATGKFEAVIFGDKVILDEEIEHWPICDFLISFFSGGFPLDKAVRYVELRYPDTGLQLLLDRRCVLRILDSIGVATPMRLVSQMPHDVPQLSADVIEHVKERIGLDLSTETFPCEQVQQIDVDTIVLGSRLLKKPFVEKPVSGEDHNINIYYPSSEGGGARRLFRKVANKSSEMDADLNTIRAGSYIYEQFMVVDNLEDVKVYTIGDSFAHAETRKSPVVDGVVRRNSEGKEVRYVTALSPEETEIARKISKAFGQFICGFDLLRANGKSYVIDVNGWSFVKGNESYYDKAAQILCALFMDQAEKRGLYHREPSTSLFERQWKTKAVLSVLRHGDRTPKQKIKVNVKSKQLLSFLNGTSTEDVVLKQEQQLESFMAACKAALEEPSANGEKEKLDQILMVLEAKWKYAGTKVQLRPFTADPDKMQVIVKWGGEFTHAGRHQSKDLGENLRNDLMLINKDLLGDVKVYTSSERRVIATAEIFCKEFLGTEDLPSESLIVTKEMLDDSNAAKSQMDQVKIKLNEMLNPVDGYVSPMLNESPRASHLYLEKSNSNQSIVAPILARLNADPPHLVSEIIRLLGQMRLIMQQNFQVMDIAKIQPRWCCSESPALFKERWEKLFRDFCDGDRGQVEQSKISELYDSLKYDLLHNREFVTTIFGSNGPVDNKLLRKLYNKAKLLFDVMAPQEYGINVAEKLEIGMLSSSLLLKQLISDMEAATLTDHPSTRLYFTKESKVICLFNIVMYCGLPTKLSMDVDELDCNFAGYFILMFVDLSQITFELCERNRSTGSAGESSETEFSLRIGLTVGAHDPNLIDLKLDSKHCLSVAPRRYSDFLIVF